MKYLILIILVFGVWWFWRQSTRKQPPESSVSKPTATMARCAHCGVYCPPDDMTIDANGYRYCTPKHSSLGPISKH